MHRLRALSIACVISSVFAACTDAGSPVAPSARPSLNGGSLGSGNRIPSDSTPGSQTVVANSCETSRNGGSLGSGNVVDPICY